MRWEVCHERSEEGEEVGRKPRVAGRDDGKLKGKDYERELARLHVELVKLQQWVVHKGLKVCIVFEGRDGAGKGGDDQGDHRARQPARVSRRRAAGADRAREDRRCTSSATCRTCPPPARS